MDLISTLPGSALDNFYPAGWDLALQEVFGSSAVRGRMREAGLAAARKLSWDAAARQMLAVLNEVAA